MDQFTDEAAIAHLLTVLHSKPTLQSWKLLLQTLFFFSEMMLGCHTNGIVFFSSENNNDERKYEFIKINSNIFS